MKIEKKDLAKSQIELTIELSFDEFKPYIEKGAEKVSREVKIEGFRPGKVPYEILKQKIGEMTILEESAHIAVNKTIDEAISKNTKRQVVGQPQISITKLAPENPLEYKVIFAVIPELTLGDYKNFKIKKEKAEVDVKEVEKMLNQLREMRAKEVSVDREVKDKDKIIVDIDMFLDKVPVDGGQSKDTAIVVGKGYIVPGFGKKIIGAKKDEVREFNLPYPKEHHQANLAGKLVEFKVKVKDIFERQLPEINEEFVKGIGLKSKEELEENIKKNMLLEKEQRANQKAESDILDKIIEKTKFSDIPEVLVDSESKNMMSELEGNIAQQGGKFDDYLGHIKKTREQLVLDLLPNAIKRVKTSLLIREIANVEKINISDNEVEKEIMAMKFQYKDNNKIVARIKTPEYKAYLKNLMSGRKVIEKLLEWNIEK
ncbi:MAG: trigger factor [Patescibacteria group bacterium]